MIDYRLLRKLSETSNEEEAALKQGRIDMTSYMTHHGDIIENRNFLARDRLITIHRHVRFVDFPEHSHDYIELVYMAKGTTFHIINGKELALCEGEVLFLGNGTRHSIRKCDAGDIAVNFIIHPVFFKTFIFTGTDAPIEKFLTDSLSDYNRSNFFHFKVSGEIPVQNLIENLIYILLNDTRNEQMLVRVTMELLFHYLTERTTSLSHNNQSEKIVMDALHYIDEHYAEGSLADISAQLNCSASWLSREIKRVAGSTYTEFVQNKRLSQAVFLLKNTNMKVSDISGAVGYENVSFFHRAFSKKYGITPSKLRRRK